jgi:hypothetical protein
MRHSTPFVLLLVALLAMPACGGDDDSDGSDGSAAGDGGTGGGDAGCVSCPVDAPQCSNGEDDDGDQLIDGGDPQCTGPADDREDSFATGIPGDNIDPVLQDCFFDGNSGEGEDGCQRPTCCLTDGEADTCPPPGPASDCSVSDQCIDYCAQLTPVGCDCFGCCTVCSDGSCYDIATGLAGDGCSPDNLDDEEACPRCIKSTDCTGGDCDAGHCVLCPGQTADDLSDVCDDPLCPAGDTPCQDSTDCAADEYCANGCCIDTVE